MKFDAVLFVAALILFSFSFSPCFALSSCTSSAKDGYYCSDYFSYELCENGVISGSATCESGFICSEGASANYRDNSTIEPKSNRPMYEAVTPGCQYGQCDDIRGAVANEYAEAVMPHCYDIAYDRDEYFKNRSEAMSFLGIDGFPSKVERDSRRDPQNHDHLAKTCSWSPNWCSTCCGGASQQEEWLRHKYVIPVGNSSCDTFLHAMVCAKKFPGCSWNRESEYATRACYIFVANCAPQVQSTFNCGDWLASGYSVFPSLFLSILVVLFVLA